MISYLRGYNRSVVQSICPEQFPHSPFIATEQVNYFFILDTILLILFHAQTMISNRYMQPAMNTLSDISLGSGHTKGTAALQSDEFVVRQGMSLSRYQFQWLRLESE